MAEKASRDRGYRSDTIALSRDMGPLSVWQLIPILLLALLLLLPSIVAATSTAAVTV